MDGIKIMAWYLDWAFLQLDDVANGVTGATVTQRNARDIIREIKRMQARIAELEKRPRGVQGGDHNTQNIRF